MPPARSMSRRDSVRHGAAGIAVLAAGLSSPDASLASSSITDERTPTTFVLVHGAWSGGWIWRDVVAALRAAGHAAYATTATGMGDRAHLADPGIDLDVYIADVVTTLEVEDLRDVTLVGWSFGGMVVAGAADVVPERLRQVVYLDAPAPLDGQNSYDADFAIDSTRKEFFAAQATAGIRTGMSGYLPITDGIEDWVRASTADPVVAEWVLANLTPQPLLTFLQPVRLDNPRATALPRAFVLCTADKDLTADPQMDPYVLAAQRARSDAGWRVVELDANHLAPVNAPLETAEVLMSLL